MLNKKGFTLVELLLAFSIYSGCLVLFISDYSFISLRTNSLKVIYDENIEKQNTKEDALCIKESLEETINQVLPS